MSDHDRHVWIQHCINEFFHGTPVGTKNRTANLHYHALRLDGNIGPATRTAIRKARYYLGLGSSNWEANPVKVSDNFLRLIKNPFRDGNESRRHLASKRRKARVERWQASRRPPPAPSSGGLSYVDGRRVATWIARWLFKARAAGVIFSVTSGFRDPVYSTSLCYRICGRPSCSGTCAGASSNHSGIWFPRGAVDCWPVWSLRSWLARHGAPLHNHLPNDVVHLSYSGY